MGDYSLSLCKVILAHMERTVGRYSQHEHGGTCQICGAHALYMAVFYHRPTNVYIKTGLDCADKMELDCGNGDAFRKAVKSDLEALAGKRKAKAILEAANLGKAWDVFSGEYVDRYEERTIVDIVGKLVRYGSVSDKSLNYVGVLLDKINNRAAVEAEKAAKAAAAAPVPVNAGRIVVTGKVISHKYQDTNFGTVHKMLVETVDGYRLWGSVPGGLTVESGSMVKFTARVEPSKNDPKFGFFSRPTNASMG